MGQKEENLLLVDEVLPPLPSERKKSSDLNGLLKSIINGVMPTDECEAAVATMESTIAALEAQIEGKATTGSVTTIQNAINALTSSLSAVATSGSYNDLTNKPTIPSAPIPWVPAAVTRSLVTGTGATGFQPSTTRNTFASYNVRTTSTASIAGNADGYVVLEVCPTNSATPANWIEIGRQSNSQILTLAVTLNSVQGQGSPLIGVIPMGWYAKIRTVTTTGTVSFSYVSGSETPMS